MAAKKKPAVGGLHSEGIVDDIILPLARKGLSAVRKPIAKSYGKKISKMPKGLSSDQAGVYGSKTGKALRKVDDYFDAIDTKRAKIYASKGKYVKSELSSRGLPVAGPKTTPKNNKKIVKQTDKTNKTRVTDMEIYDNSNKKFDKRFGKMEYYETDRRNAIIAGKKKGTVAAKKGKKVVKGK